MHCILSIIMQLDVCLCVFLLLVYIHVLYTESGGWIETGYITLACCRDRYFVNKLDTKNCDKLFMFKTLTLTFYVATIMSAECKM